MRSWRRWLFALLVIAAGVSWLGRTVPGKGRSTMVLRPAIETTPGTLQPWIFPGRRVDAARDYPASFYAEFQTWCSATLIGRDTILTSAHCIRRVERVIVEAGGATFEAMCDTHPRYREATHENDLGLCKLTRSPWTTGFERIVSKGYRLDPSVRVQVTGWGESEPDTIVERWWYRARMRLGFGSVFRVAAAYGQQRGAVILAHGELSGGTRVRLDPGDSGGAAYVGPPGRRLIVGTNACGGDACGYGPENGIVLSNLAAEEAADFIEQWACENRAHIAGLEYNRNNQGCSTR